MTPDTSGLLRVNFIYVDHYSSLAQG
jgi:hypothetical protein